MLQRQGWLAGVFAVVLAALLAAVSLTTGAAELKRWEGGATPPLALEDLSGKQHDLAAYRGRVVLVNFWATWCEPCRDEMVSMRKLQERLAGRPFVTLLVNYGESGIRVSEFVKRESIAFPVLLDPNQDAPKPWRVRVLPSSFLVDADGRVRYSVIGELDWAGTDAVNIVQGLLR